MNLAMVLVAAILGAPHCVCNHIVLFLRAKGRAFDADPFFSEQILP